MHLPVLGPPGKGSIFHDSRLQSLIYDPLNEKVQVTIVRPNDEPGSGAQVWVFHLEGVVGFEVETLGDGEPVGRPQAPEIYEIYDDQNGSTATTVEAEAS